MPWTVTTPSTPLWADSKRTFKKGIVAQTTEFIVERVEHEGGLAMGKTADVMYIRKGDGMSLQGDGWIELKNCSPVPLAPAPETIQDDPAWLFLKQLRDALDVALGSR